LRGNNRLRHVIKRNDSHQYSSIHDGNVTGVVFQHESLNLVGLSFRRNTDRIGIHDAADRGGPDCAMIAIDMANDLSKR